MVYKNGHPLELSAREFDILCFLSAAPGRVFSREELMEQVWGYDYYGDLRAVDVAIRGLCLFRRCGGTQPCTAGPWPDPRPGQKHPAADAGCRQHGGRNRHRCRCDHRLRTAPARWRAVRRLPYFRGEMSGRASLRDDASIDPYRLIFKAIPPTLRNLPLTQHLNHPPTASELLYVCTKYFVQLSDFKILLLIFPKPHADVRLFFYLFVNICSNI